MRPDAEDRRAYGFIILGTAILVAFLFVLMVVTGAKAHDPRRPDLDGWFSGLKSNGGGLCCSNMDGTALSDVDWESKNGHYRVRLQNEWVDVPDNTVITEPNRAGPTMVWPYYMNGKPVIRCFMPGALT